MSEFKIGDRVMIVRAAAWRGPGTVVSITPNMASCFRVLRDNDGGPHAGHEGGWLPTSLARLDSVPPAELASLRAVAEKAAAWADSHPVSGAARTLAPHAQPLYDAVMAHEAVMAPESEPLTVWKVVQRLTDGTLVSCVTRLRRRTYATGATQTMRSMAFSTEQAAIDWGGISSVREVYRAEADTATPLDAAWPGGSVSCTNLRLIERVWPEPEPEPTCADCGEAMAFGAAMGCGAFAFVGEVALRCSACHEAERARRDKAERVPRCIDCNIPTDGATPVCAACQKRRRLAARVERVRKAIEEHLDDGVEAHVIAKASGMDAREADTWMPVKSISGYHAGPGYFIKTGDADRCPYLSNIDKIRWRDADGSRHTIEFEEADDD